MLDYLPRSSLASRWWRSTRRPVHLIAYALLLILGSSCAGSAWINEPLPYSDDEDYPPEPMPVAAAPQGSAAPVNRAVPADAAQIEPEPAVRAQRRLQGRVLGKFRNTYYDFPSESDSDPKGGTVRLMNPKCETIKVVPRTFYEAVCVQGSGTLSNGATVSFAKRDCECAEICPRTSQKICFEQLDGARFPWGRGATGQAIVPLLTVAVDSNVIPLGTPLYIPQYDGLPRDVAHTSLHDGCFIAQDRGLRVQGEQVDIFTGHPTMTRLWNTLVPSNQGVTVVVDNPNCARATPE